MVNHPNRSAATKFAQEYERRKPGYKVATGLAQNWMGSKNHAENWNQGNAGRRVAFAVYSPSYKAWIEPKKSYASWSEAMRDLNDGYMD